MNKILLIIQREYVTRVRNKTFLLSTFLLPIAMVLLVVGTTYFSITSRDKKMKVAVMNDPGLFQANLQKDSNIIQLVFNHKIDSAHLLASEYDALIDMKNDSSLKHFKVLSKKQLGMDASKDIRDQFDKAYENYQLQQHGIEKLVLDTIANNSKGAFSIDNQVISETGSSKTVNAGLNYAIGFGSGILIYITMFIFGAMVMRGVMEEKTNRIAEVVVSSVKPFQLMMGKILGIAAVGLTQFLLWILLVMVLFTAASAFLPHEVIQQAGEANQNMPMGGGGVASNYMDKIQHTLIDNVNWWMIISSFLIYFLGGYLFYASLFAAIGSVINEDPQEAQSLMLPVTMPIIFAFIILSTNLDTPDSPIMVWASMIPFTSPIVMMGRIPSGVPGWQLALSIALLIGGFIGTTWMAGKIYRTGILLYGKKASWKEMFKWAFRKS